MALVLLLATWLKTNHDIFWGAVNFQKFKMA